uniref:Uncharacterized protein n=1 Tax=Avena sativa TaxID=4498 RepID=A0ACD5T6Q5_AVESA
MSTMGSELGRLFKLDQATHTANVEVWVMLTTLLLVVKFAIDSRGPWFFNKFMVLSLQFLEGLNSSMVTYSLALMQLSSSRNDFFQVWGVLMVTLRYSVMVGRPYGRSKKLTLSDMMSSLWSANLLRSRSSVLLIAILLWSIWLINAARIIGYFISSERASRINQENMRLVTDYMRYEPELSSDSGSGAGAADPVSMRGYKYLVCGEDEQDKKVAAPLFRFKLNMEHEKLITTESVWSLEEDKLLGGEADADNRFKDVCLSFALYKLLRRRFHNLPSHEALHHKTRRLVLGGLLRLPQEGHDHERAFRVTEVELTFLKDCFHGNQAVMFVNGFPLRRLLLSVLLVAALSSVAYPVYQIPSRNTDSRVTRGVPVSYAIIFLIILKELWEVYVYVFSQWTKVWMLYVYITEPNLQCSLMRGVLRVMFRLVTRGQWDQQVGQYNIFIQCSEWKLVMSMLRPTTTKLQTDVKKAILESLRGLLQSPQSLGSYFSSAFGSDDQGSIVVERFSWANDFAADTHRILVWHIATCLCEMELCGEAAAAAHKPFWLRPSRLFVHRSRATSEAMWAHYNVAVTLSNYCAYLLTRPPRLVPDNNFVSIKVFDAVRAEVFSATRRCKSFQDIHHRLVGKAAVPDGKYEATVKMGAELARQLLETYKDDNRAAAWQVLANFWTGFLLHLAASTKAQRHKTHLQGQGELITHLWALLSHAGFLGTIDQGEAVDDDEAAE